MKPDKVLASKLGNAFALKSLQPFHHAVQFFRVRPKIIHAIGFSLWLMTNLVASFSCQRESVLKLTEHAIGFSQWLMTNF